MAGVKTQQQSRPTRAFSVLSLSQLRNNTAHVAPLVSSCCPVVRLSDDGSNSRPRKVLFKMFSAVVNTHKFVQLVRFRKFVARNSRGYKSTAGTDIRPVMGPSSVLSLGVDVF